MAASLFTIPKSVPALIVVCSAPPPLTCSFTLVAEGCGYTHSFVATPLSNAFQSSSGSEKSSSVSFLLRSVSVAVYVGRGFAAAGFVSVSRFAGYSWAWFFSCWAELTSLLAHLSGSSSVPVLPGLVTVLVWPALASRASRSRSSSSLDPWSYPAAVLPPIAGLA